MKENCTSQFHLGRAMYEDFVLSPSHLLKQSSNILEEVSCSLQHVPHIGPQNVSALSLPSVQKHLHAKLGIYACKNFPKPVDHDPKFKAS